MEAQQTELAGSVNLLLSAIMESKASRHLRKLKAKLMDTDELIGLYTRSQEREADLEQKVVMANESAKSARAAKAEAEAQLGRAMAATEAASGAERQRAELEQQLLRAAGDRKGGARA